MDVFRATEQAYKNGYNKGYEEGYNKGYKDGCFNCIKNPHKIILESHTNKINENIKESNNEKK